MKAVHTYLSHEGHSSCLFKPIQWYASQLPQPVTKFQLHLLRNNAISLLSGTYPSGGNLQTDLAALRQEDVRGLLRVARELSLHALDVAAGLGLELGRGRSTGPAGGEDAVVELLLLLRLVGIDETLGVDPVVL